MNSRYKLLIGGSITALISGIFIYTNRLGRSKAELETVTRITPDLKKGNFKLDITVKNPGGGRFILKHPFVKLLHEGNLIGSSKVINKNYLIPAFGEEKIDAVVISIPLLSALSTAGRVIDEMRKSKPVVLQVDTVSTAIETKTKAQIPVKKSQLITLKKA